MQELKNKVCFFRSNSVNPDPRVEKEAKTLVKFGYEVDIFCWDRESNHDIEKEKLQNNLCIYRIGHKASYGGGFKNIFPRLQFIIDIINWIKTHSNKYSYFHFCDFDTIFPSIYFINRLKTKIIYDIFDFLYGSPKSFLQRIIKRLQIKCINISNVTIICSEMRKDQIVDSKPNYLVVIHNSPYSYDNELSINKNIDNINEKLKVIYIGILQDYRFIQESLAYFSCHDEYEFYIGGFGKYENEAIEYAKKFSNIKFLGKLQYHDTLKYESQSDVLLAMYDPSIENHFFAAPNKFYEALMLGKPIIMSKNTGMSDIICKNNFGEVVDYSIDGLNKAINSISSNIDNYRNKAKIMHEFFNENFCFEIMEKRLIDLYNNI